MTWDEMLKLPLETKVRLPWWGESAWIKIRRNNDGCLLFDYDTTYTPFRDCWCEITLQDQWEIYQEPKPERQYMDGFEALKLVYNGKKVALDDKEWKYVGYVYLSKSGILEMLDCACATISVGLSKKYMFQKKWYVVED